MCRKRACLDLKNIWLVILFITIGSLQEDTNVVFLSALLNFTLMSSRLPLAFQLSRPRWLSLCPSQTAPSLTCWGAAPPLWVVAGSGLVPDECAMGDIQGLLVALCALLFGQSSCSEPPTEEGLGQGGGRPDASTTDSQSPPSRCGFEQRVGGRNDPLGLPSLSHPV